MAEFSYKGVNERGDSVSGVIEAADRRVAVSELARQGYFASELSEKSGVGVAGGEDVFSFARLKKKRSEKTFKGNGRFCMGNKRSG